MRAHPAFRHALIFVALGSTSFVLADGPASKPPASARRAPAADALPPLPPTAEPMPVFSTASVPPATSAEATRVRLATEARLKELGPAGAQDKPATKTLREILEERLRCVKDWQVVARERAEAEHPERSPEQQAAEHRADLAKTRALIEQMARNPDALLPEAFQAGPKPTEARLAEMKEAIDAAHAESKERAAELDKLRSEGTRDLAARVAALRADRDKAHQECAAEATRRGEREAAVAGAANAEARDLARERLVNFEWQSRVASERLAVKEARIALETKRGDLATVQIEARAARAQLGRKLIERMERGYAAMAERQRSELKRAVVKEESRAAQSDDPLERFRAKRSAQLLELESQAIAYEKANATTAGLSIAEQTALADAAVDNFMELKKLINDGNVSPLDVLRLNNDFRRIGPERALIVQTDLAASEAEQTTYENALTDAEIDLVNDARDDRYDREGLLEKLPVARRAEADAMLKELEGRHRALLNRCRVVLQALSRRSEAAHAQVLRRLEVLDQQYAFIRTHIFWIRDAEPVGPATVAHARDESLRAAKALARLATETWDRSLWGRASAEFLLTLVALALLPWPLFLARKALDRLRIATNPETTLGDGFTPAQAAD